MHKLVKRLDGQVFGHLTVLEHAGSTDRQQALWKCRCVCGKEIVIAGTLLTRKVGKFKSCGCMRWAGKHGHAKAGAPTQSTYETWRHMIARCTNPNHTDYHNYGGRGITVCQRWLESCDNFISDKGTKPDGMTLERIDNNQGYSPENTKWATYGEQLRNTRTTLMLEWNGRTQCLTDWAKEVGVSKQVLWRRIKCGWPKEKWMDKPKPQYQWERKVNPPTTPPTPSGNPDSAPLQTTPSQSGA